MAKPTAKATTTVKAKELLRAYLRCANCAKTKVDPALRQLFVLWAPPAPPADASANGDQAAVKFSLAKTDDGGFLSPIFDGTEAHPTKTFPFASGVKYRFYFVRHPDEKLVQAILSSLNKALGAPEALKAFVKDYGEPRELEGKVDKVLYKAKKVSSFVFEIPEDPAWFIPRGSALYDGWVLFRGMPGSGIETLALDERKESHLQCSVIRKHVTRLQHHLGTLRYPVGNQWHPYTPEPWPDRKNTRLYPNEGMFEELTWNGVLRFQRDLRDGVAAVLDPSIHREPTLTSETFDPADDPSHTNELADSRWYVTSDETTVPSPGDDQYWTVVDKKTGDAIQSWLEQGLRKPGKILVCLKQPDSWMQEDAYEPIVAFSKELVSLGFTPGVQLNNALRDVRASVEKVSTGQAKRSIHKSGFAFDFAMRGFIKPRKDAPLFHSPDGGEEAVKKVRAGAKMHWIVWALVRKSDIKANPLPAHAEYADTIDRWVYDSVHPDGGSIRPTTAEEAAAELELVKATTAANAYTFLNFTRVAESGLFGLTRIPARKHFQRLAPAEVMKPTDLASFAEVIERLGGHLSADALRFGPVGAKIRIADTQYAITSDTAPPRPEKEKPTEDATKLRKLVKYYTEWLKLTGAVGPSLSLYVESWTRTGAKIRTGLSKKAFEDQKADAIPEIPGEKPTKHRVTLGPGFGFDGLYPFYVEPVPPVALDIGTEVSFPELPGAPQNMEWWHYQYKPGYNGQTWGDILKLVGWTEEGLTYVGPVKGNPSGRGFYGFQGLHYVPGDLTEGAG